MDIIRMLDQSAYSDDLSKIELAQKATRNLLSFNVYRGKTKFKAVDVTNDGKINQKEFYKFYIRLVKE